MSPSIDSPSPKPWFPSASTRVLDVDLRSRIDQELIPAGTEVLFNEIAPEEIRRATPQNRARFESIGRAWTDQTRQRLEFPAPNDPHFCEVLATSIRDPRLTVLNRPAEDLVSVAHELDVEFDAVVTSLPLVNFPVPIRNLILQAAKDALPPGGIVAGYTYTPYVVPRLMRETFGNCALRFVWRNVPPAFVFRSVR